VGSYRPIELAGLRFEENNFVKGLKCDLFGEGGESSMAGSRTGVSGRMYVVSGDPGQGAESTEKMPGEAHLSGMLD